MSDIKKILTENPLLDEIVYNCKIMMMGTILKDTEEANNKETADSIRKSDLYISSYEKRSRFQDHTYDVDFLRTCSYIPSYAINGFADNNDSIPENLRSRILSDVQKYYCNNYIEENEYYRKLNGLPPIGDPGIKISDLDLSVINNDNFYTDPDKKYLHELDTSSLDVLDNFGIIDKLKEKYPDKKYLYYLGSNRIPIYTARKSNRFDILKVPQADQSVYDRYVYFLSVNKNYFLKRVYSEAFKFLSSNYDKVLMILIVITSFLDCVAELPEYYIRNDIFDIRTVKYIFESNGIKYFEDIPLRYQLRMVKNINTLIKYKSTNKGIADICSIFGFDNIEIFKYYLLRDRIINPENNKYKSEKSIDKITGEEYEDPLKNYDLKFVKVPYDSIYDNYIKDRINLLEYDDVTVGDPEWDGPYSHEVIKNQILQKEFNIELSKYVSIDTVYELTEMTFDLPYFINMIMYANIDTDALAIKVPEISSSGTFNITDLFVYLYVLMYRYLGIKDKIFYEKSEVLSVLGFNFELNLPQLVEWLRERGESLSSLGVDKFDYAPNGIYTFAQLVSIFINNKNVYEIVKKGMRNAQSKQEYEIYRKIYESLFITKLNFEYYNMPSDKEAKINYTYTDFLELKNTDLYQSIMELNEITDTTARTKKITSLMSSVVTKIEDALNSNFIDNIFINIPTVSVDYVKNYMFEVINFFKSYKIQLLDINTIYKFDDSLNNRIFFIEDIDKFIYTHEYLDSSIPGDNLIQLNTRLDSKEIARLKERFYIYIDWMKQHGLADDIIIKDINYKLSIIFNSIEKINPNDVINLLTVELTKNDFITLYEEIYAIIATFDIVEIVQPRDILAEIAHIFFKLFNTDITIEDGLRIRIYKLLDAFVNHQYKDSNIPVDSMHGMKDKIYQYQYVLNRILRIPVEEKTDKYFSILNPKDKVRITEGWYISRIYE